VRRLSLGILGAWLVCAIAVAVATWVGPALLERGLQDWDLAIMIDVRDNSPLSFASGIMLESPGNILITLPVMIVAVAVAVRHGRLLFAIALPFGYVFARLLILEGWWLWDRARPTLIAEGTAALQAHSFPSGHILLAFYVYGMLTWVWVGASRNRWERILAWLPPVAVALLVGYSRLLLGAHWPSDTVAGFLLGAMYLVMVLEALRRTENELESARRRQASS
jgi:undecaprenyl-diphosphatase